MTIKGPYETMTILHSTGNGTCNLVNLLRLWFFNFCINNNNYITITEYIHYKTYNLQHNFESAFTLLNYEFVTKPYKTLKLLDYLQCAILLRYIPYTTLPYLTYGFITYLTYVIFLTYTRHLHWKHCKTKFKPSKLNVCLCTACINISNQTTSLKTCYGCST